MARTAQQSAAPKLDIDALVERARLEALALAALERNVVTAVYAFDVKIANGTIEPISVRERIRAGNVRAA